MSKPYAKTASTWKELQLGCWNTSGACSLLPPESAEPELVGFMKHQFISIVSVLYLYVRTHPHQHPKPYLQTYVITLLKTSFNETQEPHPQPSQKMHDKILSSQLRFGKFFDTLGKDPLIEFRLYFRDLFEIEEVS